MRLLLTNHAHAAYYGKMAPVSPEAEVRRAPGPGPDRGGSRSVMRAASAAGGRAPPLRGGGRRAGRGEAGRVSGDGQDAREGGLVPPCRDLAAGTGSRTWRRGMTCPRPEAG